MYREIPGNIRRRPWYHLKLRYQGVQYPRMVKLGSTWNEFTMLYAMAMKWAYETGLGGKHWLNCKSLMPLQLSKYYLDTAYYQYSPFLTDR